MTINNGPFLCLQFDVCAVNTGSYNDENRILINKILCGSGSLKLIQIL
jgi:hypothetical protein